MKEIKKSQKTVSKAVSTFTKAVAEVEKANVMLEASIKEDDKRYESICLEIKKLEAQLDDVAWGVMQKHKEIKDNNNLINKLSQFVGGTK